jgi:hypothetical protein
VRHRLRGRIALRAEIEMDPVIMQSLVAKYVERDKFTYVDISDMLNFFAGKMVSGFERDDDVRAILTDAYVKITLLQKPDE